MALVDEFGREHASEAYEFAIGRPRFIDHGEAIATTQIAMKIDITGKDFGELQCDNFRNAGRIGRREQRRFNFPRALHYPLFGLRQFLG